MLTKGVTWNLSCLLWAVGYIHVVNFFNWLNWCFGFARIFFFLDQENELFYFSASGTTRKIKKIRRIEGRFSFINPNRYQWNLWSHGTSSAVIDAQLKLKERDKIIYENGSLISFVRYLEKKNNFAQK